MSKVAPLIGYRHISGIQPWEPFARARFVTRLVDDQGLPFEEVAELVGVDMSQVRSFYRNYSMLETS